MTSDLVPNARPSPAMIFKNMIELDIWVPKSVVKVDDTKMIPLSYTRFAIQKSPGWTPVMICTCLALVIRSMSGNTKKTEMKRPIDKVNEFEYLKEVGSTNSSPTTSVNFTSSALGNGWLVTKKRGFFLINGF